jgi:hypothetical protein
MPTRKFILYIFRKGLEKAWEICYNDIGESFGVRRFPMKLIVCMDPRGGMMFNKRRTTSDVVVTADILREAEGGRLLIAPYSEKIFKNAEIEGYTPFGAEYTVSGAGVDVAFPGADGILLPAFLFDGVKETEILATSGQILVKYNGSFCRYTFSGEPEEYGLFFNRNGRYRAYRIHTDKLHIEMGDSNEL